MCFFLLRFHRGFLGEWNQLWATWASLDKSLSPQMVSGMNNKLKNQEAPRQILQTKKVLLLQICIDAPPQQFAEHKVVRKHVTCTLFQESPQIKMNTLSGPSGFMLQYHPISSKHALPKTSHFTLTTKWMFGSWKAFFQ